jgi:hypothetical protein
MSAENDKQTSWKQMLRDPVILWTAFSFLGVIVSYIWMQIEPDNYDVSTLSFYSWLSSLLAVGYLSTPTGSWHGKVAFAGVVIMVIGIGFKILNLPGANGLIIAGLATIAATYLFDWMKKRRTST